MSISLNQINNYFVGSSGATFAGVIKVPDIYVTSDERDKENIKRISNALEIISKLNGYTFVLKNTDSTSAGVIAQEVQKVLPHMVYIKDNGHLAVKYNALIGYLIECIKELKLEIETLNRRTSTKSHGDV